NGVTYQPFGDVKSWTFGSGASYSRSYDFDGRISGYSLANLSRTVRFDAASRITAYTHNNSVYDQNFGYDNLNRVTSWVMSTTNQSYTYDPSGNRTSITYGTTNYPYTYATTSNRLRTVAAGGPASQTFSYDLTGNTIGDGIRTFGYDARGRLIQTNSSYQTN